MEEIKKRSINPLAVLLGISALLFAAFIVFTFIFFMTRGKDWDEKHNKALFAKNASMIAVIDLKGVIMDSKKVLKNLKAAEENDEVKAVVLKVNSPGGAVAPSQEIYEQVKRFPKPLVISISSLGASGAMYVAAGAKKIYANSGSLVGSIGVIMEFANLKKLYEWAKVERFTIKTGKFKDSGAEFREMRADEKEYFQGLVDDSLVQFKTAVRDGRKMTQAEIDAVADGRVFTGQQAKALKLVDELGTFDDAVTWVAAEAKIKGKPKLVYPSVHKADFLDLIMRGTDEEEDEYESENRSFVDRLAASLASRILPGANVSAVQPLPVGLYWLWDSAR